MNCRRLGFATLFAVASAGGAPPAYAQSPNNEHLRPPPSSMCRVTGTDAQGALRTIIIRADGSQNWTLVEEVVLIECRAAYRLQNCTIISCRP
jgi:hypothetical protein